MSQPNELHCDQKCFDFIVPKDLPSQKIIKIHKIRKERRRKRRTICINTCVILENGVDNPQKKVFYQKFTQFISKSKDFQGKHAGEIAQKYEKSLIQKIKSETFESGKKEIRSEYGPFFLIPSYQQNVGMVMYPTWQGGYGFGLNYGV